MTSLTDPNADATVWSYGVFGQAVSKTITVDSTDLTRYFQYDSRGNLARKIDRNGRVTQYEYDGLGRQTSEEWFTNVEDADADPQTGLLKEYTTAYDSLGRVTTAGDGDTDYVYTVTVRRSALPNGRSKNRARGVKRRWVTAL